MLYETISLKADGVPEAALRAYVLDNTPEVDINRRRPAVIICPGGGYRFLSDREAEPVAIRFLSLGIQAFVLYYSVKMGAFPAAQRQLALAVSAVRRGADKWNVDARRVAVMGFSAGGHLAACGCTLYDDPYIIEPLGLTAKEARPDAGILCYPVIEGVNCAHEDSFRCLLGGRYEELREKLSLSACVTEQTPPAFIWHTFEDGLVPVENALLYAQALRAHGVPFELHVFQRGGHGLSLSNDEVYTRNGDARPEAQNWPDMAARWLKQL